MQLSGTQSAHLYKVLALLFVFDTLVAAFPTPIADSSSVQHLNSRTPAGGSSKKSSSHKSSHGSSSGSSSSSKRPASVALKPKWFLARYDDEEFLTADDKRVFEFDLSGHYPAGAGHHWGGDNNNGFYEVVGHHNMIIKMLRAADNKAFGEVKALNKIRQMWAAGHTNGHPSIVLPYITDSAGGRALPLSHAPHYTSEHPATQKAMREEVRKLVCEHIIDAAKHSKIWHGDLSLENILITGWHHEAPYMPTSVYVTDWGRAYAISSASDKDLHTQCKIETKF
ncbi:hypothetical protein BDP27DRAFT_1421567 [Rhodocollybia butyracea]|uniref:Non-specific serine/threonine protein kinase n=1 Tax=Rhodocollybia butyracea TaxID=206335 RepID=A0A9P5PRL0_9AGAR|nr:hypothetical protein BDP27DRAFT_1421567 [Rhodocollybia butyracea]